MSKQIEENELAIYCDEQVELIGVETTEYGVLANIRFEDGREDQVPLARIDYL